MQHCYLKRISFKILTHCAYGTVAVHTAKTASYYCCFYQENSFCHSKLYYFCSLSKIYILSTLKTDLIFWHPQYRLIYCSRFLFFLDVKLICQEPAHFLSAQMAMPTRFLQVFIVQWTLDLRKISTFLNRELTVLGT